MTLEELIVELEPVTNWFFLGLYLPGVPVNELHRIRHEHMSVEYSRIRVLATFLENRDATDRESTWLEIVKALATMGELQLSKNISSKYGKSNVKINSLHC